MSERAAASVGRIRIPSPLGSMWAAMNAPRAALRSALKSSTHIPDAGALPAPSVTDAGETHLLAATDRSMNCPSTNWVVAWVAKLVPLGRSGALKVTMLPQRQLALAGPDH